MSGEDGFRTPEQEVTRLLEDCSELRRTLQSIAAQIGRMEARVKKAFPEAAERIRERNNKTKGGSAGSLSGKQAVAEFEDVVRLASIGSVADAERRLHEKSAADLLTIAKEVGITFGKSKPSVKMMREAIFGRVRESILLSRHNPRS